MKADDNRKVTLYLHERGQRWPAVLKPKVDFMHRVADKDGIKEPRAGRDAARRGSPRRHPGRAAWRRPAALTAISRLLPNRRSALTRGWAGLGRAGPRWAALVLCVSFLLLYEDPWALAEEP